MKIRVKVITEPQRHEVVTIEDEVTENGDLERVISDAISTARQNGLIGPWGWSLSVEQA